MILTNVYSFEQLIKDQLIADGVFASDMVFTSKSEVELSNKKFKGKVDSESNAVVILYEGFDPSKDSVGKGSKKSQRLLLRYRLLVVSPESLYYDNAGIKFVECLKSVKNLQGSKCVNAQVILDVHEFHLPDYTNNMVALPQLWQFEVII